MIKNRTIAYIGLWVLILPYIGLTQNTKTLLYTVTGAYLMYLGNKMYHKSKAVNHKHQNTTEEDTTKKQPNQTFSSVENEESNEPQPKQQMRGAMEIKKKPVVKRARKADAHDTDYLNSQIINKDEALS